MSRYNDVDDYKLQRMSFDEEIDFSRLLKADDTKSESPKPVRRVSPITPLSSSSASAPLTESRRFVRGVRQSTRNDDWAFPSTPSPAPSGPAPSGPSTVNSTGRRILKAVRRNTQQKGGRRRSSRRSRRRSSRRSRRSSHRRSSRRSRRRSSRRSRRSSRRSRRRSRRSRRSRRRSRSSSRRSRRRSRRSRRRSRR